MDINDANVPEGVKKTYSENIKILLETVGLAIYLSLAGYHVGKSVENFQDGLGKVSMNKNVSQKNVVQK